MKFAKIIKKSILLGLLTIMLPAQAGWVPQWLTQRLPEMTLKNSLYFGLGTLTLTSTSIAGYLWYKKQYLSKKKYSTPDTPIPEFNFETWKEQCTSSLPLKPDCTNHVQILSKRMLESSLEKYLNGFIQNPIMQDSTAWVNNKPTKLFNSVKNRKAVFAPYVQKIKLPHNSQVSLFGDIHGDIHSANDYIAYWQSKNKIDTNMTIIDDTFYMFFLGDYVDRGLYGPEVINLIMQLKAKNPEHVILIRGNHEDAELNKNYKFNEQLEEKFNSNSGLSRKIQCMYETLPLAVFLGCGNTFALCCHGNLEPGFDKGPALIDHPHDTAFTQLGELKRETQFTKYCKTHPRYTKTYHYQNLKYDLFFDKALKNYEPSNLSTWLDFDNGIITGIGFQWNDVSLDDNNHIYPSRDCAFTLGKKMTKFILESYSSEINKVLFVFRAHQHTRDMAPHILHNDQDHACNHGVGRAFAKEPLLDKDAWQLQPYMVHTLSVCPNAEYQDIGFTRNTCTLLTLSETSADDWKLEVIEIPKTYQE